MGDVPFRLDVIETPDEWLVMCACPQGHTVAHVRPPFTADELRSQLHSLEMELVRSTSPVVTRKTSHVERTFGRELSKVLLAEDVRVLFALCREKAREQRSTVRVLLNPVGPNVSRVPWEFAVDPDATDDFLALRVPLVRSPHLMEPSPPLQVQPPLRVLGVMSRPTDRQQLEADRERRQISAALTELSSDLVYVEWMESHRWQELRTRLKSQPWHILHYVGHGGFDEDAQSGYLELTADDGTALRVEAGDLARLIMRNSQLKLVVLNACESATAGSDGVFSSTAAKLMRSGVPAVVAMQYEITDPAALAFACSFYEAIARGYPVDRAVTQAREDVKISTRSLEWATPVLFLASEETQIFAMPETPPPPPPRPAPQAGPAAGEPAPASPAESDWSEQLTTTLTRFVDKVKRKHAESDPAVATRSPELGPEELRRPSPAPATPPTRAAPMADVASAAQSRPPTEAAAPSRPASPDVGAPPALRRLFASPPFGQCAHFGLGPNDLAALACGDGVRVVSLTTGRETARCTFPRHERSAYISWSPWPRHLAAIHHGGVAVVWELESETPVHVLRTPSGRPTRVEFSHNGRWLAVACDDCSVHVFNTAGAAVRSLRLGQQAGVGGWQQAARSVTTLTFTPDDKCLLVGSDDGLLQQFDVHARVVLTWRHADAVNSVAVAADRIATGRRDGRIRTWRWDGAVIGLMDSGSDPHVAFSSSGELTGAVAGATCFLWDTDRRLLGSSRLSARGVGLGFSSSSVLVTATDRGTIEAWSAAPESTDDRGSP